MATVSLGFLCLVCLFTFFLILANLAMDWKAKK